MQHSRQRVAERHESRADGAELPSGLAGELSAQLGARVELALATEPVKPDALGRAELRVLRSLPAGERSRSWLLGRAALKELLPEDTSRLAFPHRSISLTHSGGTAVAVRTSTQVAGIGVDFEPWRALVHPDMARFFLRPREVAAATSAHALVRLWTIKEALFKALPYNDECVLLDFELADPRAASGSATGPRGHTLRYAAADVATGCLSVAVTTLRGSHVPV